MSNYHYSGNLHPFAVAICHSADQDSVAPVLEKIAESGLRLCLLDEHSGNTDAVLKKAFAVFCILSDHFYESGEMQDILVKADRLNKELIPMLLEETAMPELIVRLTYTTNFISLPKYTPAEAAARILEAPVLKAPKRTKAQTGFVRAAGIAALVLAVVIGAVAGFRYFAGRKNVPKDSAPDLSVLAQYGLTEADLAEIRSVTFIGDRLETSTVQKAVWDYLIQTEDGWVRKEDGRIVEMGGPEDFGFLRLLPNLKYLNLINQSTSLLPDLKTIEHLSNLELWNCAFSDLEGLRGSQSLSSIHITSDVISDLSPLTDCSYLNVVHLTGCDKITTLAGFCPPALTELQAHLTNLKDLSSLSECRKLRQLNLKGDHLEDISALSGCTKLSNVRIDCFDHCPLTDFSALGNAKEMQTLCIAVGHPLDIDFVRNLTALEFVELQCTDLVSADALSACPDVNNFALFVQENPQQISMDFLRGMKSLRDIKLGGVRTNMDFMEDIIGKPSQSINLEVYGGDIRWDGLRHVPEFGTLIVNLNGGDGAELLEAIRETPVQELQLFDSGDLKASDLPVHVDKLVLVQSYITSLEGISAADLTALTLGKCRSLKSLEGIEQLEKLEKLDVYDSLRLADWSALYGKPIKELYITRQYILPDFGQISIQEENGTIALNEIPELTDLSCLDVMPDAAVQSGRINISAVSNELNNLNALLRFKGWRLTVTPQLEQQAKDLVQRGCFKYYEINYPDENWDVDESLVEVKSLEELETLPKALLKFVTELNIANDTVYSMNWGPQIWGDRVLRTYMCRWETDERILIDGCGTKVSFDTLSQLTGLRDLRLTCQKMDSLAGIQNLEQLENLSITHCDIPDYSALFAVDSIRHLRLDGTNITSIQGIQNLNNLVELDLQSANVTDLTPLTEMTFCRQAMEEGFSLCLPHTWMVKQYPDDLSALAAVPVYNELNMNGYHDIEWVRYVAGKDIRRADLLSMFNQDDGQQKLQELAETIGSICNLDIKYNEALTDLTCLNKIKGLEEVWVSSNMNEAIRSLDGVECNFELKIED